MSSNTSKNIVIIGGGIIGCTTAYYIVHHPSFTSLSTLTLIEASIHGVAHGASGKAGGLVAKWAYPKELALLSFREHVSLAKKHSGKDRWGWRFVNCGSWEGRGEVIVKELSTEGQNRSLEKKAGLEPGASMLARKTKRLPDDLNWVSEELTDGYSPMAPSGNTAQVHPYLFTTSILELAKEKGLKVVAGRVTEIRQSNGQASGVTYIDNATQKSEHIPATHVILSAGAWSPVILPQLPISSTRAHSIVIRPKAGMEIGPYVLFTEISLPSSARASPEIYARPNNEVYACGPGDDEPLPPSVDEVEVHQPACESLLGHVASISPELREGTVEKRQACYLPLGGPIIGEASKLMKGLFVSTGHTCWGICNAPGSAKAISELVMEGKISCANLRNLDPSRFLSHE